MDTSVTTIFLSMALTIAFTRLVGVNSPGWDLWVIFFYFVSRKVSYYVADVRFNEIAKGLFKAGTVTERMFNLFFGIGTLFLFIVAGYYVVEPIHFFFITALALLVNIGWLILLLVLIDPSKDNNEALTIRQMFHNFIKINIAEIIVCVIAAVWLQCSWSVKGISFGQIKPWLLGLSLGILGFIMLIDFLLHKHFLFDPDYSTE